MTRIRTSLGAKALFGLGALALAGALTACSSSGAPSAAPGNSTASTASAAGTSAATSGDATAIKIGVICGCTNAQTHSAGNVIQAWAKSVNESGGIAGHPIELTIKDDQLQPSIGKTIAGDFIAQKVAVVLDLSQVGGAWYGDVTAAGIPIVGGSYNNAAYESEPLLFPAGQTLSSIAKSILKTAQASGATKIGTVYCAEYSNCQESLNAVKKELSTAPGISLVYDGGISSTAPNYTAQCLAAKQAGADGVYILAVTEVSQRFVSDCIKQGYEPKWIVQGTGITGQVVDNAQMTRNLWAETGVKPFFALGDPGVDRMIQTTEKYYPGTTTNKPAFSMFSPQAWAAGLLVENAIAKAAPPADTTIDAAYVISVLENFKAPQGLDGFTVPLAFEKGKPHIVDAWFNVSFKDGKPVVSDLVTGS